ncbi:MAG TPA: serine/threonine-protein kinase [Pyrinomonadaceae bacterium]|jgi:serine/threonine protein kinase
MTSLERYVGQVLDEKYRLERLLGQGGMGAVYLATHLGTERYVALKLITPQFMRNEEFVERFKREARAAGRLRHPNVVDVTDFGFARTDNERVAYLVMEYLDGCTLGDVLAEETRLPLDWVVDILEQVCSAVHEAHQQGIVHRDLKPDNIWLEPNRLGGYRVKVLDFGIAKLAEAGAAAETTGAPPAAAAQTATGTAAAGPLPEVAPAAPPPAAADLTADTLLQPAGHSKQPGAQSDVRPGEAAPAAADDAGETRLFPAQAAAHTAAAAVPRVTAAGADADKTRMLERPTQVAPAGAQAAARPAATAAAAGLTRVGALMGTPLYMSPEQCRGLRLDARSDIYSLGVIAYQMLAGAPPFAGDTLKVIEQHTADEPRPLRERNPKVPKRVAHVVMSALAKDPAARPVSAAAFAAALHAHAEGVGALVRRAVALYSEHFPKFLRLSLVAHIPVILLIPAAMLFAVYVQSWPKGLQFTVGALLGMLQTAANFLSASVIVGMTALMVTQLHVAPHKPLQLRTARAVLRRRWRPYLRTSFGVALRIMLGYVLLVIPGLIMTVRYAVYGPVVLMEGLEKKPARRRARELASRSWRTVIAVAAVQICIPMIIGALAGALSGRAKMSTHGSVAFSVRHLPAYLVPLSNILIVPLTAIMMALLYLKMRQMGGESLGETLAQFETVEPVSSRWQQRMRTRLTVTPVSRSKNSASGPS